MKKRLDWFGVKLRQIEASKPFTEHEAWGLFRIAALAEGFGWSLLITGIIIRNYGLLGHNIAVPIAGRIHGTFFLAYFGILIATYSSLGWSRRKLMLATIAGVPPFGSLIFEQWAAHKRNVHHRQIYFSSLLPLLVKEQLLYP